jgi:hypothetical protein
MAKRRKRGVEFSGALDFHHFLLRGLSKSDKGCDRGGGE